MVQAVGKERAVSQRSKRLGTGQNSKIQKWLAQNNQHVGRTKSAD